MKILIILVLVIAIIAMVIYALMDMFVPKEEKPKEHYPLIKLDDDDDDNYPKIVEHEFFVTKDSGYYVSVWPRKDRLGICQFEIAGMYYRERIEEYSVPLKLSPITFTILKQSKCLLPTDII